MQTISEFDQAYGTDAQCREYLFRKRWPDSKVKCVRCGSDRVFAAKTRPYHWICKSGAQAIDRKSGEITECDKRNGYRFSVITGTIFQDTKIKLNLWFKVGYLMLTAKKGMSALQIHRIMFGEKSTHAYHTSWYMCIRWRAAMAGDMYQPLKGIVEVDETYVGGKDRNRHWHKKSAQMRAQFGELPLGQEKYGYGKIGVIGAIARKGNVVARVIGSQDAPTLSGFVRKMVDKKVSLVVTDENQDYNYLGRDINHESVSHSKNEWVRGEVHTNNIESFWSLIKRGVVGNFHHVSKKYLPFYLNEFSFRFNNRNNEEMFAALIETCSQ
jgi:IS1 family transposase